MIMFGSGLVTIVILAIERLNVGLENVRGMSRDCRKVLAANMRKLG